MVERIDCDLDFAEPAGNWIGAALKTLTPPDAARSRVIEVDFGGNAAAKSNAGIVEAEIVEHLNLNSSRSDKETIHLALAFDGAVPAYEPGDSLDLYRRKRPGLCRRIAGAGGSDERRRIARRASHQLAM